MGQSDSKSDTVVLNEQLNVSPVAINSGRSSNVDVSTINIILIVSMVTIFWIFVIKLIRNWFKKQVRAYAINV
jgi:hypothetical protein